MPRLITSKRIMLKQIPTLAMLLLFQPGPLQAGDTEGGADYPGIGRFKGSEISYYSRESYGSTVLATGPVKSAADAQKTSLSLDGRITRIVYKVPKGVSALEVFRNFEQRISDQAYTVIFSGGPDQINAYNFSYNHPVEKLKATSLGNKLYYLSARKSNGQSVTHLSLLVSPHSGGDGQRVRLIAVESKTMEAQMVDADAMQSAINEIGKVALYGIYFDSGSVEMQASSKPTLQEIARLLKKVTDLNIIVVGHTDYQGGYDFNMDLSERRARSVVRSLTLEHRIPEGRLRSAGVGYLAPAASNESEDGRTLNRRVELVKDQ